MRRDRLDISSLSIPPFPIEASPEAIENARSFVFQKWIERHEERAAEWERATGSRPSMPVPEDLTNSCKFTSAFAAIVFGGHMEGNYNHQYAVIDGNVLDLNEGSRDVKALKNPYTHDPIFFGSRDHRESIKSCLPRVRAWLEEYASLVRVPSLDC